MQASPVARVIISISAMLFAGFAMTRITKRFRLPNVTGYILAGILMGPCCLNVIPQTIIDGTDFLSDVALAFIAFSAGEFFKMEVLRRNGAKVIVITVLEACLASVAVFILVYGVLHLELSFSIVLSALASATAPASTMMTIRQTGAHGDFVDTLLQVVALDDVVGLILYSVAISVAMASQSGSMQLSTVIAPILANICVLALGALFGVMLKLFFRKRSTDNRLIVSIATLFAFCGICAMADISPLLGCMSMGMTYINLTGDEKLFRQLGYWSPPILLLFFVRSGLSFNLGALTDTLGASGSVPLLLVGILYFAGRIVGKYAGAYLGALAVGKGKGVRNYLGLALIPQAGVAIGLAVQGSLSNLAGGVLILLLKPFKVGDYIVEGSSGKEGTVKEIQIFYTKLLTYDNQTIILPNGNLANNTIVNVTAAECRRCDVMVSVSYSADLKKAKEVLTRMLSADPNIMKDRDHFVFVDALEDSGINLCVRCWFKNEDFWQGKWRITENCKYVLDEAGIEIPFPQMDVHMR